MTIISCKCNSVNQLKKKKASSCYHFVSCLGLRRLFFLLYRPASDQRVHKIDAVYRSAQRFTASRNALTRELYSRDGMAFLDHQLHANDRHLLSVSNVHRDLGKKAFVS